MTSVLLSIWMFVTFYACIRIKGRSLNTALMDTEKTSETERANSASSVVKLSGIFNNMLRDGDLDLATADIGLLAT